ncbi:MAG: aldo/keto reductase [Thermoguttaceae bacterium]|nr:aldo/keto reductase [Thermoguttaceae bacterium]
MERREIGQTGLWISPVTLGCWPMAGMTSPGATEADSIATIHQAMELGINHLDTAFGYGRNGESEQLLGRALEGRREQVVLATKGGMHWGDGPSVIFDSSPERLRQQLETSLRRLKTDYVDLYYLHHPDPERPIEETAELLRQFRKEGKIRSVGVSNFSLAQLQRFHTVCPLDAFQPAYSMLERGIEADRLPWCREHQVSVHVYWVLVKGLLAGKMRGDETFENDHRKHYPMFQGEEYQRNLALVERLRTIAAESNKTVAQLVVRWTIDQPGITTALCGAKRPEQIEETAGAMGWSLSESQKTAIEQVLFERGEPSRSGPFGNRVSA